MIAELYLSGLSYIFNSFLVLFLQLCLLCILQLIILQLNNLALQDNQKLIISRKNDKIIIIYYKNNSKYYK